MLQKYVLHSCVHVTQLPSFSRACNINKSCKVKCCKVVKCKAVFYQPLGDGRSQHFCQAHYILKHIPTSGDVGVPLKLRNTLNVNPLWLLSYPRYAQDY